ncbi:MAG: uroporphyrinogen-III synthase [Chloroflexi bacterium]|nr:uroporphyrinogen-III synthase [Chloroflexota bacterium]
MSAHPLAGKRIVITRPPHQAQAFANQLRALGAEPVILPTIEIRPPADPGPLDAALTRLSAYVWLVLTSANAVEHVWGRIAALDMHPTHWPQIAVIGPATAGALEAHGLTPALMPDEHVAEALADALIGAGDLGVRRVLLPQANLARPVLAERLRAAGAIVDAVIAYETVRPMLDPALLGRPADAFTFTSSSTVHNFVEQFDDPAAAIGAALIACIGPVTADAARARGLPVHVVAEPYTVEGLITALSLAFEKDVIR